MAFGSREWLSPERRTVIDPHPGIKSWRNSPGFHGFHELSSFNIFLSLDLPKAMSFLSAVAARKYKSRSHTVSQTVVQITYLKVHNDIKIFHQQANVWGVFVMYWWSYGRWEQHITLSIISLEMPVYHVSVWNSKNEKDHGKIAVKKEKKKKLSNSKKIREILIKGWIISRFKTSSLQFLVSCTELNTEVSFGLGVFRVRTKQMWF